MALFKAKNSIIIEDTTPVTTFVSLVTFVSSRTTVSSLDTISSRGIVAIVS